MWRGPCDAAKACYADPLAIRLVRRAAENNIGFVLAHDGRSAEVYRLERRQGNYVRIALDPVEGGDPLNVIANFALQYTPHDPDLFDALYALVLRRLDEVTSEVTSVVKRLGAALDALDESATILALRYV
jgi:hypothetical protein